MAEKKAEKPVEVSTAYMAVRAPNPHGDLHMFEVLRIERRGGKLSEERMNIPPATRAVIGERLRVLNSGRDVLP